MTLLPDDPKFTEAGLSVLVDGRAACVMDGEVALAQVAVRDGQLEFLPNRSAKQKAVLRRIGAWAE